MIFHKGKIGETYNIGGNNEWKNIDLVHLLCDLMDEKQSNPIGQSRELITYVSDRSGHDLRYAIDSSKIQNELGWKPKTALKKGLKMTINWYQENGDWMTRVTSGTYQKYYTTQYKNR